MTIVEKKREFNKVLFAWHKKGYRDMPWRPKFPRPKGDGNGSTTVVRPPKSRGRDRASLDPYRILVSEIMLQQTQVDRVRTKYVEFLKKFPSVEVLAKAPLGEVLQLWSGLGYNRRAKYLHQCAKEVVASHGGKFPKNYEELVLLPGIGMSTAGALLAFSFGHETPMIDTNIRRILTRVFFKQNLSRLSLDKLDEKQKRNVPRDKELYEFAQSLIPRGKGREWNYAMLDLGATLCTARNHSDLCPLMKLHGSVSDFVYKKPQKKFKDSRRYYRGQILKHLSISGPLRTARLPALLGKTIEDIEGILDDLKKEHLVSVRAGLITLPR